jgi:hypothetical protein
MKRLALALALLPVFSCVAQDPTQTHAYAAACGPVEQKLDADLRTGATPPLPDAAHAVVYLIQDQDQINLPCIGKCASAKVRIGEDGAWAGATSGGSFAVLPVAPGPHHLCVNWQSRFQKYSHHEIYLHSLQAEAGSTYYFRIHVSQGSGGGETAVPFSLTLEPLDEDEARLLLEISRQSVLKK